MEKEECGEGSSLFQGETCHWNPEPLLGWERSPPKPRGQGMVTATDGAETVLWARMPAHTQVSPCYGVSMRSPSHPFLTASYWLGPS